MAEEPPGEGKAEAPEVEKGREGELDEFVRIATGKDREPASAVCRVWSVAKRAAACVLLLPIRIVLVLLTMVAIWALYRLAACCCGPSRRAAEGLAPHSRAERALLRVIAPLWRFQLLLLGVAWLRVRRVGGAAAKTASRPLPSVTIVANHVSTLDGPVLACLKGCLLTGVAMRWVCQAPYTSSVARAHHVLPVGRPKKASADAGSKVAPEEAPAKTATDTIVEYQRACAADSRLLPLVVFPEGWTKASRCLLKFRTGAFVSGEPVLPVCLRYPDHFAWIDSLPAHLLTLLTSWFSLVELIVLPLYEPSEQEKQDPKLYASNVQAAIAAALDLPPERSSTSVGAKELAELIERK